MYHNMSDYNNNNKFLTFSFLVVFYWNLPENKYDLLFYKSYQIWIHVVICMKMEFNCTAKNSDSFDMKKTCLQGASCEVQRCVESNGVLSFKAHRVVHSQRAFSFSLPLSASLFLFLTIERAQMLRVEERCTCTQLRSTRGTPWLHAFPRN